MAKLSKCRLCLKPRSKWIVWRCPARHQCCAACGKGIEKAVKSEQNRGIDRELACPYCNVEAEYDPTIPNQPPSSSEDEEDLEAMARRFLKATRG